MVAKGSPKKSEHPTYEVMVVTAIKQLKERKGSSKQAVMKYITTNYKLKGDPNVHAKVALRKLIKNGKIDVSKGTGLSGRFKLKASAAAPPKKQKKAQKAKKTSTKVAKKPAAQAKKSSVKKSPKKSPKKAAKKSKSSKKPKKSPQKKQSAKRPAAKKQQKSAKKAKKSAPRKKSKK